GMKNPNLQLMVHSKNIAEAIPLFKIPAGGLRIADGIMLKAIHHVENPNYVFLDLVIASNAKPGVRKLEFAVPGIHLAIDYELMVKNKEDGKTRTQGITSKDFLYLMIPDRFSDGDPSNDIVPGYRDQTVDRTDMWARHGGDFKGIENHFDYFRQLGV